MRSDRITPRMGLWDKVKETAQKAAEAAKDQLEREDSLLNKAVDKTKEAADKAVVVAKDQVHREGSALNRVKAKAAATADRVGGGIDNIEAGKRDESIEMAKRYSARKKGEAGGAEQEEEPVERKRRFPNTQQLSDEEVYKSVAETMYPDFRSLPPGDKRVALCEIARYDKKLTNLMRAIGSAYIDTYRNLAEGDDGYQAALDAVGLWNDRELKRAYKNWLDDSYDEEFYQDDDGGHRKAVRMVGWLVFARVGGAPGETGGESLTRAFGDAGVRDQYGLGKLLATARTLLDARQQFVMNAFKPRREAFNSQFLVQRGINADMDFNWLDDSGKVDDGVGSTSGSGSDDDGGGFSGGSLMEL